MHKEQGRKKESKPLCKLQRKIKMVNCYGYMIYDNGHWLLILVVFLLSLLLQFHFSIVSLNVKHFTLCIDLQ